MHFDRSMAAVSSSSSSSCRRRSHGFLLHLSVIIAAASVAAAAGSSGGGADDHVLSMESLFPSSPSCHTPQQEHRNSAVSRRMKIVHRHGPCSPLANERGKPPSNEEILAADQSRVASIHSRASVRGKLGQHFAPATLQQLGEKKHGSPTRHHHRHSAPAAATGTPSSSSSSTSIPASSGVALGAGNYVVTVGLGTPASGFTVVFDTGSDTTWVQCRPCVVTCYKQKDPLFDPSKSSTYANISCASSFCSEIDSGGCSGGTCVYGVQYGAGSYTVGFFAQDTLTVSHDAIHGFRFGCGVKNSGLFGKTAGLLGLGRGKTSLTVQAQQKYSGAFSYCLPATSSSATGYLDFGPGSASSANNTPMLTDNGQTFYYVGMTSIRVEGKQLVSVPESVFTTAGTIVDSGTVITRLPATAYAALSSAFASAMSARGYKKVEGYSILDTCYDFTRLSAVKLPTVSLVFQGGACLEVDASGIMYPISVSQVCLAFAPNDDDTSVAIIGNTQQKTYAVLFDIGKKVVGFTPGAC